MGDTETYKGCTIRLEQDTDAESPREWDNVGTIVHWHRRYDFGERISDPNEWVRSLAPEEEDVEEEDDMGKLWELAEKNHIILPISLLDHSGLHIWVGSGSHWSDSAGWDSGQVGYIYCTMEQAREEWGNDDAVAREQARKCMEGEIATFDVFLRDQVMGWIVEGPDGEDIDSCWGYYPEGNDYAGARQCAREAIDRWVEKQEERAKEEAEREAKEAAERAYWEERDTVTVRGGGW